MASCGVSRVPLGLVFAYGFSGIAPSRCVFAASAAVRGLRSCFPPLRLFARLRCRLSLGGVAMFHVKHFEACEKRTENVSRETFVCRNVSSEGASSAASLVALVRCRERSVLRASRGPCLVRDAPGCPGMGAKRAAWARAVEGGVADRRARRTRRTRRAQGVPLCAARSVRRPEVWRGRVAMLDGVALRGRRRLRGRSGGGRRRSGRRSAWTASLGGAALRGQHRLRGSLWGAASLGGASLCGGWPRSGSRFAGTASLGVSSCDGVSPWAAQGWAYRVGFASPGGFRAIRRPEGIACGIDAWGYA